MEQHAPEPEGPRCRSAQTREPTPPAGSACPVPPAGPSCSRPRRPPSSSPATTRPPWTTSPSERGLQAGAVPALPRQARALPRPPRRPLRHPRAARARGPRHRPGQQRSGSTRPSRAYFDFVSRDGAAFRLIFESDLTNESAVRNRLDSHRPRLRRGDRRGHREDTDMPESEASLLGMALDRAGPGQRPALAGAGPTIPQDEAARLVGALAWRGLGSSPRWAGKVRGPRLVSLAARPGTGRYAACAPHRRKATHVEVKIGVQRVAREITFETEASAQDVAEAVTQALEKDGLLTLTDDKGRRDHRPRERPRLCRPSARASGAGSASALSD